MNEPKRQVGFWATLKVVMWSFCGVRKRRDYQKDAESLNLKAVIVAGVLGGVIFVLSIVAFVRYVVAV